MRFASDIIGAVKARKAVITESLAAGNCVNFEAYQRLVGQLQGLDETLAIINQMLEDQDNDR